MPDLELRDTGLRAWARTALVLIGVMLPVLTWMGTAGAVLPVQDSSPEAISAHDRQRLEVRTWQQRSMWIGAGCVAGGLLLNRRAQRRA
ncbi:hypothetical protein HNR42_002445 [Deinobacterium chartae]|uniref:Uncharacterized protein n=1 Tax=Deinobacterium chartae TaxID=521158 RepID=A0A841I3X0_9DEIO|nr:hypothetical protein [Deinobacterium chartae]MBB6099009.1 hypothetical protein [Deinobacterium chartae]